MTMNNRNNRRGVTLLVVLGLMTMFAMLVTAFMVITTQARRTAEHAAQALLEQGGGDGGHSTSFSADFDPVIEKLLIGGLDNVIGPHSILENLYGHPNFTNGSNETKNLEGTFNGIPSGTDYIEVSYSLLPPSSGDYGIYQENDLIGSVITITGAGKSTFIIGNDGTNLTLARNGILDTEITGDFIINSPAFSGTGPGFNPGAVSGAAALEGKDDEVDAATGEIDFGTGSGKPLALRPNILAPETTSGDRLYKKYLENNLVLMNPDYTAPDYQNMFLAWNDVKYDTTNSKWYIDQIIPSFHRPQLVRYWDNLPGGIMSDYNELRKIVLRPLPTDHPNFTGSNPAATLTNLDKFLTEGPWDVDNDGGGVADGIWLDLGFAPVTDPRSGKIYKKLVSYYVLDMDGRLNVNVHGNPDQINADNNNDLFGSGSGPAEVRLDIALGLIKDDRFTQIIDGDGSETGRYGAGNTPGDDSITTDAGLTWGNYKLMGINPLAYGYTTANITIDGTSESPVGGMIPDLRGEAPVTFDTFGNRNLGSSGTIYAQNPYLLNPYETGADSPFSSLDFQYLIRSVGDVDYTTQLPKRIRELLGEKDLGTPSSKYFLSQYRLFLGTRSSDIPVFSRVGGATNSGTSQGLYHYIYKVIYSEDGTKADAFWELLPEEIRRGEKVNLNRLTFHPHWITGGDDLLKAKAKFAQEIYYLLCVLCYDQIKNGNFGGAASADQAYTRLAQWSVNLVDFIDPDATMTPFVFSTDPFNLSTPYDNAADIPSVIGNTLTSLSETTAKLIWGMEKPEVALTKTFATHNRRIADSRHDSGGNDASHTLAGHTGGAGCDKNFNRINLACTNTTCTNTAHGYDTAHKHDDSFDQVLAPEGSLFVELYRQGNLNRVTYQGDLDIDTATKELNLAQTVTGGTDYVWRLAIGEKAKDDPTASIPAIAPKNNVFKELSAANKGSTYSFQPKQWIADAGDSTLIGTSAEGCEIIPERFIWFGPAPATSLSGNEINFYNADTTTNPLLEPNKYLVIGPRTETSFLSKQVDDDPSTTIADDTSDDNYALHFGIPNKGPAAAPTKDTYINLDELTASGTQTMIAEASPNVGVSVTEPKVGYTGTFPQDAPYTHPDFPEADGLGTITGYKAIFLQRLADPTRDHNSVTNPYITVDWNMIDLHVINSERDKNGLEYTKANDNSMIFDEDLKFAIRQWGYSNWKTPSTHKPVDPNIWDRSFDAEETDWKGPDAAKFDAESQKGADLIWGYRAKGIADAASFVHFPWHDAPLANTYELMLVPAATPGRFGFEFHDHTGDWANASSPSLGSSGMRFASTDGTAHGVSPYLNFFASGTTSTSLDLSRLFEYVRVPSKFAGTISGWIPGTGTNPDTPIYAMREPGKINLNTATEPAWEALSGNSGRAAWHNYNDTANLNGLYNLRNSGIGGTDPSEFVPFRSPQAVNLVPPYTGVVVSSAADATLLRSIPPIPPATTPTRLLEPEAGTNNPYTALESYMRLSDMTTTRSNVFAVWATVGYFEVKKYTGSSRRIDLIADYPSLVHITSDAIFDAVYPDGCVLGAERGLDNGSVKRHRAFYLIDRSTPVGFRRGESTTNFKDVIVDIANSGVLE